MNAPQPIEVQAFRARPYSILAWARSHPTQLFWVLALIMYGSAAVVFAKGVYLLQPTQDIWQHLAALRALIEDPINPHNPFVVSDEGSRHFHPQWVLVAMFGRALGWNEWQSIGFAAFVNAAVLALGIYVFAKAYYKSAWGPLALLIAMTLSWTIPVHYTGFHSWTTFSKGGAYPAMLLIGLSLIGWGLTIRALEGERTTALVLLPLAAFMFATHQLGAVIGFFVIGCLLIAWPEGNSRQRAMIGAFVIAGAALSALWPYHNPFETVARAGNPTWIGSHDFYSLYYFTAALVPSGLGLWGLARPRVPGTGISMALALAAFTFAFALIPFGILIGERFLMPAVLILQVGVGAVLLRWFSGPLRHSSRRRMIFIAFAFEIVALHIFHMVGFTREAADLVAQGRTVDDAARDLTADIPDDIPVAAYDVAAWPVVASGQKVVAIPWPDPLIGDLERRQAANSRLFDISLSKAERHRLASQWGTRTLILDERYAWERLPRTQLILKLASHSVAVRRHGPMWRFDLKR